MKVCPSTEGSFIETAIECSQIVFVVIVEFLPPQMNQLCHSQKLFLLSLSRRLSHAQTSSELHEHSMPRSCSCELGNSWIRTSEHPGKQKAASRSSRVICPTIPLISRLSKSWRPASASHSTDSHNSVGNGKQQPQNQPSKLTFYWSPGRNTSGRNRVPFPWKCFQPEEKDITATFMVSYTVAFWTLRL